MLFQDLVLSCFENLGSFYQFLELDMDNLKTDTIRAKDSGPFRGRREPLATIISLAETHDSRGPAALSWGILPEDTQL